MTAGKTQAKLERYIGGLQLANVLTLWREAEPQRFPYRFGGMGWFEPASDIGRTGFKELGAAVEAADVHGWPFELRSVVTPDSTIAYEATVRYGPLGATTIRNAEPIEALLRAMVVASVLPWWEPARREPSILGMAMTSFPLTANGVPPTTTPAQDLRVWARTEPEWFGGTPSHHASPTHRGVPCHVLAPVHRALVALMYMPALTVVEAAASRNWGFRVRSQLIEGRAAEYECEITLPDGSVARGATYPAIAPACVKAYLAALELTSAGELDLAPRPTDRFMHEVLAVECEPGRRLRTIYNQDREWAQVSGTLAVRSCDLDRIALDVPPRFRVIEHVLSADEVEAAVAVGLLPAS